MFAKPVKCFTNLVRTVATKPLIVNKPTTNGEIKPIIYNRNPRNLEKLRLQRKPVGYYVDKDFFEYWHKLELKHSRYVTAVLIHNSGKVVVTASTKEWAIQKVLYSPTDKQAYVILAKVFAERCLESGINELFCIKPSPEEDTKHALFLKILEEEKLILEEAPVYNVYDIWRRIEKKPWTVLED